MQHNFPTKYCIKTKKAAKTKKYKIDQMQIFLPTYTVDKCSDIVKIYQKTTGFLNIGQKYCTTCAVYINMNTFSKSKSPPPNFRL